MTTTALAWAFGLVMLIGLFMLVDLQNVWRDLFKGGDALGNWIDRRYPGGR